MYKFKVEATYKEFLPMIEIEAEDAAEAKLKYQKLWNEGMIPVHDSMFDITKVQIV